EPRKNTVALGCLIIRTCSTSGPTSCPSGSSIVELGGGGVEGGATSGQLGINYARRRIGGNIRIGDHRSSRSSGKGRKDERWSGGVQPPLEIPEEIGLASVKSKDSMTA